ncbi:hypothetical protein QCA50_007132 [Cerrena zonata]|uniref:Uncharacterized protein n=1 Tax=Cerrena zonata TaxID=2478898 RepID=A0AAW0FT27_9APHY
MMSKKVKLTSKMAEEGLGLKVVEEQMVGETRRKIEDDIFVTREVLSLRDWDRLGAALVDCRSTKTTPTVLRGQTSE